MLCIKCSKEIQSDAVFCPYCGKRQDKPERTKRTRGNGLGSVYKMPAGTWAAEITLGWHMEDGALKRKRRRKYGFKTKKAAIEYLTQLRAEGEKRHQITVSELHEMWLDSADKLSKSKQDAYRIAWAKIKEGVGYRPIEELTVPELQELTDDAGTSYYTKRDIKSLLSHCYKLAIRDDYADKNRAQYIQLGKLEQKEREVMTEEEIRKLWDDYHRKPSAITAQMLTMLYTGIRPGELLTIRKENVHMAEHYMTGGIKTEKGKRRKIILPDCILPLIEKSLSESRDGLLAKYAKNGLYDAWNALRDELHMRPELTPYCCRHTYVTRLTALKVSPAMLQELAGHEDYDTTLDYTHLSVRDRLIEVNRLQHPA